MGLPMWVFWLALIAMVVALLGVLVPVFPDIALIWFVILVYAIAEGFGAIDPFAFIVLTLLGVIGVGAEFWMSQVGAKAGGASNWSLLAAVVLAPLGAAIGFLFLGVGAIPGALLGALIGLVVAEWYQRRDWEKTMQVLGGWLLGYVLSVSIQLAVGVLMIVVFAWQVLAG
mgnify:CR=1 FL=1